MFTNTEATGGIPVDLQSEAELAVELEEGWGGISASSGVIGSSGEEWSRAE